MEGRTEPRPDVVGVLPVPPLEVYVTPVHWYGSWRSEPTPVLLVGALVHSDGSLLSVVLSGGIVQVLDGDFDTVELLGDIEGYGFGRRAS